MEIDRHTPQVVRDMLHGRREIRSGSRASDLLARNGVSRTAAQRTAEEELALIERHLTRLGFCCETAARRRS